jgi:tetratricopeptide (TPR) repeat protein
MPNKAPIGWKWHPWIEAGSPSGARRSNLRARTRTGTVTWSLCYTRFADKRDEEILMGERKDLFEESMQLGHSAAWDLNWDRAIEFYRKALTQGPNDTAALMSLGLALFETGRYKEALATYHRATKLNAEDPVPLEKCAEIFEILGQPREAIEERNEAAKLYLRRKNIDKALENWSHIARIAPDNLQARSQLAIAFERLNRRRKAVHEYLAVASILQRANKTERAIDAVQRAQALQPGDPTAANIMRALKEGGSLPPPARPLGVTKPLRTNLKSEQEAAEQESVAREAQDGTDPESEAQERALTTLASLLFEDVEQPEAGEMDLREALRGRGKKKEKAGDSQPLKYRHLGEAIDLQTRGHRREAVEVMQRAIDAGMDHPAAFFNLGMLYKSVGDVENARKYLLTAVGDEKYALGSNLALGRMAQSTGELREAARYLLQALRLADSMSVSGERSNELNQLYDSILATQARGDSQTLSQIVESTLDFLGAPDWLQKVHRARQRIQSQARSPREKVVPLAEMLAVGGSEQVFEDVERIDNYMSRQLWDAAMEEAMLALDQAPNYLPLHERMADVLVKTKRPKAALEKLSVLGETYFIRGNLERAIKSYTRALQLSPVNIPTRHRLINLLVQVGKVDEALAQYLRLAELHGDMAQIEEKRKSLGQALRLAQGRAGSDEMKLEILRQLADIDMSRLNWKGALDVYQQMQALHPEDEHIHLSVIDLHLRLGQDEEAGRTLDRYLERLVQQGRGSQIIARLEDLTREHPGRMSLHERLAKAYLAAGRKAEAISQFDALGELQMDAGQTNRAIVTIQRIIELQPPEVGGYRDLLRNLQADAG